MKEKQKKPIYIPPVVIPHLVILEDMITAASAITKPQSSSDVTTQWETEADDVRPNFNWE